MQYNTISCELLLWEKSCQYSEFKTFIILVHKLKYFWMSVRCISRLHHHYYCKESLSHVLTIWIRKVTVYAYSASNSGLCISVKWEAHTLQNIIEYNALKFNKMYTGKVAGINFTICFYLEASLYPIKVQEMTNSIWEK